MPIRSIIPPRLPLSSEARIMLTYSVLKTLGWRERASENDCPASTSALMSCSVRLNLGLSHWSATPPMASRMLMPALIMTAIWLVKPRTSLSPGPFSTRTERICCRIPARPSASGTTSSGNDPCPRRVIVASFSESATRTPERTCPPPSRTS